MNIPGWTFLNFYSAFIAMLLFVINQRQGIKNIKLSKLFARMTLFLVFLLLIDSFGRFERNTPVKCFLNSTGNFLIFLTDPMIGFFIANFIEELTTNSLTKKRNKIMLYISYSIIILNAALVVISEVFRLKWFYYYENNVYIRGPFFTHRAIAVMSIAFFLMVHVMLNKNILNKKHFYFLYILPIAPPLFGGLQIFVNNYALEYCGMVLTCLTFFTCTQNKDANNDYLTNTINRRCFNKMLSERIEYANKSDQSFSIFMIDLDKFKKINDDFGHETGDKALVEVSNILKETFKKSANICRYGGDEFCIISELTDEDDIEEMIGKIQGKIENFNIKSSSYKLGLSIGYSVYNKKTNIASLLKIADDNMYLEKVKHHELLACEE